MARNAEQAAAQGNTRNTNSKGYYKLTGKGIKGKEGKILTSAEELLKR